MMIKKILLLLTLIPTLIVAQDKIVLTDGNVKMGRITSDDEYFIKYINTDNQSVSIKKDYVKEIYYENTKTEQEADATSVDFGYNIVSYNFFALVYKNIGFSYERVLKSGFLGVKIPINFALGKFESDVYNGHVFQTGVDLNLYPLGQGKFKYFLGPSFRIGEMVENSGYSYFDSQTQEYVYEDDLKSTYIGFMFNNGMLFQPTKNFSISINAGLGLRDYKNEKFNEGVSEVFFQMEASVGYRF